MSMIEKVAAAIRAANNKFLATGAYRESEERWTDMARAAVEAMREPTEAMLKASNREWDGRMSYRSSGAWQAMIDAGLSE